MYISLENALLLLVYVMHSFLIDSRRLWIGHASALLFAKASNISLYIWEQDKKSSSQLMLRNMTEASNPSDVIHLFYTGQSTHFDLLVQNTVPKSSSLPATISAIQQSAPSFAPLR